MLTSMGLWILSAKGDRSVVSGEKEAPAAVETQKDTTAPGTEQQGVTPAAQTPQPDAQKQPPEKKKEEPPKKETSPDIKK
jgi:preprotein translocase subunit SecG